MPSRPHEHHISHFIYLLAYNLSSSKMSGYSITGFAIDTQGKFPYTSQPAKKIQLHQLLYGYIAGK